MMILPKRMDDHIPNQLGDADNNNNNNKSSRYVQRRKFWLVAGCALLVAFSLASPALRQVLNGLSFFDNMDTITSASSSSASDDQKKKDNGSSLSQEVAVAVMATSSTTTSLRSGVETDGMWEWHYIYDSSRVFQLKTKNPKKMLIAIFSSGSPYLEITKPVNIAYAQEWNHDVVFLNAAAGGQSSNPRKVNPSTLLAKAWEKRDDYEQVLILDADAMFHDFTRDVSQLLHPLDVVRAKREEGAPKQHTASVLAPVTLWNLRHMLTPRIQIGWNDQWKTYANTKDPSELLKRALVPYEEEVNTVKREFSIYDSAWIKFVDCKDKASKKSMKIITKKLQSDAYRICRKYRLECRKHRQSRIILN